MHTSVQQNSVCSYRPFSLVTASAANYAMYQIRFIQKQKKKTYCNHMPQVKQNKTNTDTSAKELNKTWPSKRRYRFVRTNAYYTLKNT